MSHLISCLGDHPFQAGRPLSTIEEECDPTELVTSSTRSYTPEREVFIADLGHHCRNSFKQLEATSADENTMEDPQETDQQK